PVTAPTSLFVLSRLGLWRFVPPPGPFLNSSGVPAGPMIQLFRSKIAKQITVVFFAFLMVAFLLTGVDYSALGSANTVGTINGKAVDSRTYETIVQQQTDAAQRQSPASLSLEDVQTVRDRVWEQMI